MRAPGLASGVAGRGLMALATLLLLAGLGAALAHGERAQRGDLIVALDGGLTPLKLPRERAAPVSLHLKGGLQTADGAVLPRVSRVEIGLPGEGVLSTRGLAVCSQRRLGNTTTSEALAACRGALVGRGRLRADVVLPHQEPFEIDASLLAFNGRVDGRRAVIVHAFAARPPTVVTLPFVIRRGSGRFTTALVAELAPTLGPWPHFAHFALTLSRRYRYRGRTHSYLSASCPIPRHLSAGFFSLARARFTFADGNQIGTGIARSCRAR